MKNEHLDANGKPLSAFILRMMAANLSKDDLHYIIGCDALCERLKEARIGVTIHPTAVAGHPVSVATE